MKESYLDKGTYESDCSSENGEYRKQRAIIRCDENVTVGDFVGISYNVKIWDTNTHEFEQIEQRRERWKKLYLKRDVSEKPRTSPVHISSDTWIGENVAILKGTTIGERCIVGFGTLISGKSIPDRTTVLNKSTSLAHFLIL